MTTHNTTSASSTYHPLPPVRPNTKPLFPVTSKSQNKLPFPSPLNSRKFKELLYDYPCHDFPELLANIIDFGAKIGYTGPNGAIRTPNHSSARTEPTVIEKDINSDLELSRLIQIPSLPQHHFCSPLGLTPKTNNGCHTGWRRIFDLSCPAGKSVNDGIEPTFGELKYETFDAALQEIAKLGKGTVMMKRDIKSAFRHIPISTEDHHLLIFEWKEKFYVDLFLPFGLRTAPFIFNLFAEALHWILQRKYSWILHHYLDDFIIFFPAGTSIDKAHLKFKSTCTQLGFMLAKEKDIQGTVVDYLGLILDSDKMEARLPPNKKDRVISEVTYLLAKKSPVTWANLQSVLGFLTFCTRVFPLGRPFLRHLFNMLSRTHKPQRLTLAARRDLIWWKTLLPLWSGISAIAPKRQEITIATDASGRKGIGGIWLKPMKMFSTRMPRRHRTKHINYKEMFAILYAFAEWCDDWKGQSVNIHCDNDAVVKGVNKSTIRGAAIHPLQSLLLLAATRDIVVRATWIPTKENAIADALSRFDMKRLANLVGVQGISIPQSRQPSQISKKISLLKQTITYSMACQNLTEPKSPLQ